MSKKVPKFDDAMESRTRSKKKERNPEYYQLKYRKSFQQLMEEDRKDADENNRLSYADIAAEDSQFPPLSFCAVCGFYSNYICVSCVVVQNFITLTCKYIDGLLQTMELDILILVVNSFLDLIILYILISLKHPRRISAKYDLVCNFFLADLLANVFGARFDPWYSSLFTVESKSYHLFDKYLSLTCLANSILTLTFLNLLSCNGCFQRNPVISISVIWILSIVFFTHSYVNKDRTFWNLLPLAIFSLICVIGEYVKRAISFEYWRRADNVKVAMPLVYIVCNTLIVVSKYHMENEQGNKFAVALFMSINLGKNILLLFFMSRADSRIKDGLLQCFRKKGKSPSVPKLFAGNNDESHLNTNEESSRHHLINQDTNSISSGENPSYMILDLMKGSSPRKHSKIQQSLATPHCSGHLGNSGNPNYTRTTSDTSKSEQPIYNADCHKDNGGNNVSKDCNNVTDSSRNTSTPGHSIRYSAAESNSKVVSDNFT
ncbi:hypothetical protein Trydic_g19348 [Trypoxylus dichotomus]